MEKIIVYVDDAAYALQQLQPMPPMPPVTGEHALWVLVACAPQLGRHAGKWLPRTAWSQQWADTAFAKLAPALRSRGGSVQMVVASGPLHALSNTLAQRHGPARTMDLRRSKFGHRLPSLSPTQADTAHKRWQLPLALASVGAMLTLVGD